MWGVGSFLLVNKLFCAFIPISRIKKVEETSNALVEKNNLNKTNMSDGTNFSVFVVVICIFFSLWSSGELL